MTEINEELLQSVNKPGRIGVLATADSRGRPNAAYFGSPRLNPDGTLVMGLGENRSLTNLEQNPFAVFFTIESGPVDFNTPGWRLYLKVSEIQREGPVLDKIREAIAQYVGQNAAQMIKAGVVFEVTEVRSLIANE